jgi:N-acetylmuramoyl-L-alanine amidase
MRVKATTIQQVVLGLALLAALCWNLAQANEINRLELDTGPAGTRAELHLQTTPTFKTFTLSQPDRLVIDLTGVDPSKTLQLPAPAGLIKAVRTGRPAEATTRIVFDLSAPVAVRKPRLETGADGVRLVLEWPSGAASVTTPAIAASAPASTPVSSGAVAATSPASQAPLQAAAPSAKPGTPALPSNTSASTPLKPATLNSKPATVASAPSSQSTAAQTTAPASALVTPQVVVAPAATNIGPNSNLSSSTAGTTVVATSPAAKPADVVPDAVLAPATPSAPAPMPRNLSGRPLIVAIDAGHGGQDPGAIGPTGKREKDVTLAIARELARQVNATPGLKAVLTRDADMFLPLPRRTQFARQAKADIFISIHADAAENRSAKGSSVYVLSLRGASSQRARWLADKENAADLIGGHPLPKADNTLTSVLLDLTQSGQMRASETAAAHVLTGLKDIGYNHKPNIERANFSVLRTSDMPAMLVETAFISNADEERRLTDPIYQRSLARAVLAGVDTYFQRQPPPGTLYAARAKAAEAAKGGGPIVVAKATAATLGGSPE